MNDTGSWPQGPAALFCPANRPDRFVRAAQVADLVILDLEDAVAAADRPAARSALLTHRLDPDHTIVRVNAIATAAHHRDIEAVDAAGYHTIMLAKTGGAADVTALAPRRVVALCETAAGVLAAAELAQVAVALMFGAEDFAGSVGATSSRGADGAFRPPVAHARDHLLLAAAAYGRPCIDAAWLAVDDPDGLHGAAATAAAEGFAAMACIHPSQVDIVRAAYQPTDQSVTAARRILAAAASHAGAFVLDGNMIDEIVVAHARRTLHRAGF